MIKVSGVFKLTGSYEVELNMTEEQFYALSERQVTDLIDSQIDWLEATRNSELDEIEVYDLQEWEEEK